MFFALFFKFFLKILKFHHCSIFLAYSKNSPTPWMGSKLPEIYEHFDRTIFFMWCHLIYKLYFLSSMRGDFQLSSATLQIFTTGILPNYDLLTVILFELQPLIVHCHWSYCKIEITIRLRPIDCKKLNYYHWQYLAYDCTVNMKLQSLYSIKMPKITMDWL